MRQTRIHWGVFTTTLLLDLSGLALPARVSEWHHREPRVGDTMLAPNFARIDAERLKNEICSIRRGPLGRAAALEIAARHGSRLEVRPFVASRDLCTWRLAHAFDLPRDHPRTRQALPERLDKTFPPDLAFLTAGQAPARTRARDLVSNRMVWRLSPPQPSRRAARLGVRIILFSSVVVHPSLRSAR